jgi:hypothetical protein
MAKIAAVISAWTNPPGALRVARNPGQSLDELIQAFRD